MANLEYTEKLKRLIKASAILSYPEQSEWLALLDLMNQKQLTELEKILNSRQYTVDSKQEAVAPVVSKPAVVQPSPARLPRLSHIMNLPNLGNLPSPSAAQGHLQTSVLKSIPLPEANKKSGFAEKLKMMFREKELPAGKVEAELSSAVAGAGAAPLPPKPKVPTPFPSLPPAINQGRPLAGLNSRPSMISNSAAAGKPASEVNFSAIDEKIQNEILAVIKDNHPGIDNPPKAPAAGNLALEDLGDLTMLSNKALQSGDFNFLVSKVRDLVKSHGYFEVIFNLEKSPLYKNYIKTGLELLNKQAGFEQLSGGNNDFLTRQQFEKLADLLRQIQVS